MTDPTTETFIETTQNVYESSFNWKIPNYSTFDKYLKEFCLHEGLEALVEIISTSAVRGDARIQMTFKASDANPFTNSSFKAIASSKIGGSFAAIDYAPLSFGKPIKLDTGTRLAASFVKRCCENRQLEIIFKVTIKGFPATLTPIHPMVQDLEKLYEMKDKENGFADTTFVVNGKDIRAHSAILAARGPLSFKTFNGGKSAVRLDDISVEAFENFLRFLYTGKMKKPEEYVMEFLKINERLGSVRAEKETVDDIQKDTEDANKNEPQNALIQEKEEAILISTLTTVEQEEHTEQVVTQPIVTGNVEPEMFAMDTEAEVVVESVTEIVSHETKPIELEEVEETTIELISSPTENVTVNLETVSALTICPEEKSTQDTKDEPKDLEAELTTSMPLEPQEDTNLKTSNQETDILIEHVEKVQLVESTIDAEPSETSVTEGNDTLSQAECEKHPVKKNTGKSKKAKKNRSKH